MSVLRPGPTLLLVDATLGDGGHAMAWLQAGGIVFGVDRDGWAIRRAEVRLERWEKALTSFAMSFSNLAELPIGEREVWAVLLDLGTSMIQIENESRGFSYLRNGPLDMRMDQTSGKPLSAILNRISVEQLATWLSSYGDVPAPRRVAKAILAAGPPETSDELVSAVVGLFPPRRRNKDLARVFQALRIATNQEQQELSRGLSAAVDMLRPGGRVAVLTYHSGEERAVRDLFRRKGGMCVCPPGLPCLRMRGTKDSSNYRPSETET